MSHLKESLSDTFFCVNLIDTRYNVIWMKDGKKYLKNILYIRRRVEKEKKNSIA